MYEGYKKVLEHEKEDVQNALQCKDKKTVKVEAVGRLMFVTSR